MNILSSVRWPVFESILQRIMYNSVHRNTTLSNRIQKKNTTTTTTTTKKSKKLKMIANLICKRNDNETQTKIK